ncbi:hypothetical protein AAKU64_002163 [Undibacterium sp. GrIS 1.8]|uniref:sodium-dependent bicarbonate transport family permease n=1 Tax=Undibacterium sp. GrIS 1.8 TaxID=3143934 RepID=UPI00339278CD
MQSILDPAILFFAFGIFAGMIKSNLDIPPQLSRFLSLYLLMALGLKGGFALAHSGLTPQIVSSLGCAILLAVLVPALGYQLLKRFINHYDAAAIAATYGSVSAVTFITAVQYLENHHLTYGGHMAAAMALMESPAIIMAVIFANTLRKKSASGSPHPTSLSKVLHESLTDGAQLLLLGSMVVGIISGESGKAAMQPFSGDLFKGMLAFFLLDMGLMAARKLPEIKGQSPWIIVYAVVTPLCHAALALGLACLLKLPAGDASLLMVLAASASYIAVTAVLRYTIPEANPSLYLGMSLGITFPLNIFLGIPLYIAIAHQVIGVGS